jgi:serine protease DegQ
MTGRQHQARPTVRPGRGLAVAVAYALLAVTLAAALAGCEALRQDSGTANRQATPTSTRQGAAGDLGVRGSSPQQAAANGLIPDIVSRVEPSVVTVKLRGGSGSGVIWDAGGVIVTNNHVVESGGPVQIAFADGSRAGARMLAADPRSDLAVLRAERTGLPAAVFADALPRVGELAIALGSPLGFENTVTAGIVSGLGRSIPGSGPSLADLIQTDAPISPGNSGGALVNAEGKVIGLNVAYIPPEASAVSIGFAIPSPRVVDVVRQLLDDGTVDYAYLGVRYQEVSPNMAQQFNLPVTSGVVVTEVIKGSPAASAGLRPGDIIVEAGGRPVRDSGDLTLALRDKRPGDQIPLEAVRSGEQPRQMTVTLGQQPARSG